MDTSGRLRDLRATAATVDRRAEAGRLAKAVQATTGESVGVAFADQGHAGDRPVAAAEGHGTTSGVVRPPEAERGFALRRRVVGRSFARAARYRGLAEDQERLHATLAGPRVVS